MFQDSRQSRLHVYQATLVFCHRAFDFPNLLLVIQLDRLLAFALFTFTWLAWRTLVTLEGTSRAFRASRMRQPNHTMGREGEHDQEGDHEQQRTW